MPRKIDNLVTKNFLQQEFDKFEAKMDKKFNKVMESLDKLMGVFKKVDEEQTVSTYQIATNADKLEEHEGRIKKLETVVLS